MTQALKQANIRIIRAELKKLDFTLMQVERAIGAQVNRPGTPVSIVETHGSVMRFVESYISFLVLNTTDKEKNLGIGLLMNKLQRAL